MKKLRALIITLPIMFMIAGCPVGIEVPLGTPGTEKIDKQLIGKWIQPDGEIEVKSMEIEKLDDYTLKLTVTERGAMYMDEIDVYKGWCTEINGQKFAYFQDINSNLATYYHYAYTFAGKSLVSYDFSLLDGGIDSVSTTTNYRTQVITSMSKPEFLSGETVWVKK